MFGSSFFGSLLFLLLGWRGQAVEEGDGGGPVRSFDFRYNDSGGTYTWTPTIPAGGWYKVYARWTAGFDRPADALYTIFHTGGSTVVPVDQRGSGVQWVYLGSYDLVPSSSHRVELSDGSPSRRLVADAVLFEWEGNPSTVVADAVKFVPAPAADALYVHTDHLGAPQAMTDLARSVVWRLDVRPFGETEALAGAASNNQRFPGQYADAESGYSYNKFRDYEPALGRYLESDPIGLEGGVNTYAYVGGNPTGNVDEFGLDVQVCCKRIPIPGSFRHCYLRRLDPVTGDETTRGLHDRYDGRGTIIKNAPFDLGNDRDRQCGPIVSDPNDDAWRCVGDTASSYPDPSNYSPWPGPNSNTFAATCSNKCDVPPPPIVDS